MAKRFTDTDKYKKPFLRGLQGAYKLLWDYLYHDCDHAGIWIVDFEIAQIYLGADMPVNAEDALRFFNSDEQRVVPLDNGKKWFIPSFIEFQYGELNPKNKAHGSVLKILKKYEKEIKGLGSSLQGVKDKEKDKDKDKEIREIIDHLNETCGTSFKYSTKTTREKINARLKEGFTVEDFKKVISNKHRKWADKDEYRDYLRPDTLFSTKFESYLNEPEVSAASNILDFSDFQSAVFQVKPALLADEKPTHQDRALNWVFQQYPGTTILENLDYIYKTAYVPEAQSA